MKSFIQFFILITFFSCNSKKTPFKIDEAYQATFEKNLLKRTEDRINYLQLTGLFKLDSLENTFGRDSINDFALSTEGIPATIGTISVYKDSIVFTASNNIKVRNSKDSIIINSHLKLDKYGSSIKLFYEHINWQVITRSGQYYLRVWDTKNPAIKAFKGFKRYKLTTDFIFQGQFTYYKTQKTDSVHSQLGVNASTNFIGNVAFNYKGKSYQLDVGEEGFAMVSDETTGDETYGGGRYIYLDLPKTDGLVTLDFNYLHNPPCAFSEFTTCLYPPRQNVLPFKILVGETINFNAN